MRNVPSKNRVPPGKSSRKSTLANIEIDQGFIGARQAAAWLGIPVRSLHQYVQRGLLPSYKLGRHRLFRREEILTCLQTTRLASRSEILR